MYTTHQRQKEHFHKILTTNYSLIDVEISKSLNKQVMIYNIYRNISIVCSPNSSTNIFPQQYSAFFPNYILRFEVQKQVELSLIDLI